MSEAVTCLPILRRVPGGWVGFVDGTAWPVHDPQAVAAWPDTTWRLRDGLLHPEPEGEAPAAAICMAISSPPATQAPRRPQSTQAGMPGMRLLRGGAAAIVIPRALLERLVPWAAPQPLPFAPPSVAGLALAGGAVLVLAGPAQPPLLAVLRVRNRLIGLGCVEARPDAEPGGTEWLPEDALSLAPLAPLLTAPTEATRAEPPSIALLFCQAGGLRFALPALEVDAVLPPTLPAPAPPGSGTIRGVVAHRGQVLPVLDAGLALGATAALAGHEVPMLRLAGPVAVAVSMVEGLRRLPLTALSPANHGGAMRAVCWPAEAAVPVLEPAWLARGA